MRRTQQRRLSTTGDAGADPVVQIEQCSVYWMKRPWLSLECGDLLFLSDHMERKCEFPFLRNTAKYMIRGWRICTQKTTATKVNCRRRQTAVWVPFPLYPLRLWKQNEHQHQFIQHLPFHKTRLWPLSKQEAKKSSLWKLMTGEYPLRRSHKTTFTIRQLFASLTISQIKVDPGKGGHMRPCLIIQTHQSRLDLCRRKRSEWSVFD